MHFKFLVYSEHDEIGSEMIIFCWYVEKSEI